MIYEHATLPQLDPNESALVVSETLFGMDGDAIDAVALLRQLHDEDVLLFDEAHALGVAGPEGAGVARHLADPRVLVLGTLSKALGALGGFVAGPSATIDLLVNRARSVYLRYRAAAGARAGGAHRAAYHARRGGSARAAERQRRTPAPCAGDCG